VSKGQAPSRLAGRVNLNIAGPVEVGRPCQYGRPRRGLQAAWEVGPIRGLVSGVAERQGADRRFQREVCRAPPGFLGEPRRFVRQPVGGRRRRRKGRFYTGDRRT
jgi:hypothetical protein